jgi:hypothetical protein
MIPAFFGPLAQLVEQKAFNLCVIGSTPIRPTIIGTHRKKSSIVCPLYGPLAQLVEQKAFNLCVIGSTPIRPTITTLINALVAQLDRVLGFEPRCRGFESLRAHHLIKHLRYILKVQKK